MLPKTFINFARLGKTQQLSNMLLRFPQAYRIPEKIGGQMFLSNKTSPKTQSTLVEMATKQQQQPKQNNQVVNYADRQLIFENINKQIDDQKEGRLFAVVHLCGKQFKITAGDIIIVEGYWPPQTGDKLRLDKVLVAGGMDFTLIGRPILDKGLVDIEATVVEKCLSHTRTHFRKKRRKQYMRINFYRSQNTMLMINSIDIVGKVNNSDLATTKSFKTSETDDVNLPIF